MDRNIMIKFLNEEQKKLISQITGLEDVYSTKEDDMISYTFSQKEDFFNLPTTPTQTKQKIQIDFFINGFNIKTNCPEINNIDSVVKVIYGIEELKNEIYISEDAIKQLMDSTYQLEVWLFTIKQQLDRGNDKITKNYLDLLKDIYKGINSVQFGINSSSVDAMKFIKLKNYVAKLMNNMQFSAPFQSGSDEWNGWFAILSDISNKIKDIEKEKYEW